MYGRLILRNVRRSAKDYLIYLVTLTLCVGLFYAFLSISSRYYHPPLDATFDLTMLGSGMKGAICALTLLLLFLIRYVSRYMLQQRQKEFAVQTVLGMEQKTTAWLFFAETFLMGLAALGLGILLGVFLSQFITAMLLANYGQPFQLAWSLFPDTAALTLGFFALSFLAVGLWNVRSIQALRPIDMLQAVRRNEVSLKHSRWMPVVTGLYLLALLGMTAENGWLMSLYYSTRYPLIPRLLFWGNLLVPLVGLAGALLWFLRRKAWGFPRLLVFLAGQAAANALCSALVPPLDRVYFLPYPPETMNVFLLFLVIDGAFLVCSVIYLSGRLLLAWKERSPSSKYTGERLFFFGQVLSKLTTTSKSMSLICLTLILSTFLFLSAPALVGWAQGYLAVRAVYDIQISSDYNRVIDPQDLPMDTYSLVSDFLAERGIETETDCTFHLYLPQQSQFHDRYKYDFPVVAMALSDYNTLRQMAGYEAISLAPGEFTTQWQTIATQSQREDFLQAHPTLDTDGGRLTLAAASYFTEALGETIYNDYTDVLYILPDSVCQSLLPVMTLRFINTAAPLSYENATALSQAFTQVYPEETEDDAPRYSIRTATQQINESKAACFLLQAAMTYGAVVLMVSCFTILSLQQLWDASQYRYRFGLLAKLGVEEETLHGLIAKQLALWFGLPIGVAAVASLVVVTFFFQTISTQIAAYMGFASLLPQVAAIVGILLLLLLCYFAATYTLFKRAVCP